jgi:hypothetical protein
MIPVDMQEVYGALGKVRERLIEGHPQKRGEFGILSFLIRAEILKDRRLVRTGVLISAPRVDSVTLRVCPHRLHGLTEGVEGIAALDAKLDEKTRSKAVDNEESKGDMLNPKGIWRDAPWLVEDDRIVGKVTSVHLALLPRTVDGGVFT